ncbi:hypothetical protein FDP41_000676 [Naegleria fowleri]|uniref:RGS domain-containing protein n=1 Tax=Naegleria fowleri TaxID=5763 RepID=A0A6A5C652_NAEFO|nr:uncharacterized protein FDP41_000676 [Naegleria fowleri]KAF0984777.1 hypothetical protein FDP41_000676 [Naegleria fowleri]
MDTENHNTSSSSDCVHNKEISSQLVGINTNDLVSQPQPTTTTATDTSNCFLTVHPSSVHQHHSSSSCSSPSSTMQLIERPLSIKSDDHDDISSCWSTPQQCSNTDNVQTENSSSEKHAQFDKSPTNQVIEINIPSVSAGLALHTSPQNLLARKGTGGIDKSSQLSSVGGKSPSRTTHSHGSKADGEGFKLYTCCGVIEFSWIKTLNLFSLFVNLVAFLTLGALIIASYSGSAAFNELLNGMDADTTFYRNMLIASARSCAFSNQSYAIAYNYSIIYNNYRDKFITSITEVLNVVPPQLQYHIPRNLTIYDLRTFKASVLESQVISLSLNGSFLNAMSIIESDLYKYYLDGYEIEYQPLLDYYNHKEVERKNFSIVMTTLSLIVICVSIAVVIPVVIASIAFSLKRDSSNTKKIKQMRANLLQDTMKDEKMRELFRAHCASEFSLENFMLLDKITDYKNNSEKSFQIQEYLYDNDSKNDETSSTVASSSQQEPPKKKKTKKGFTEKDLLQIEKKKFEIAFEIYSEFLDVNGEHSVNINKQMAESVKEQLDFYATGQSEHLPDQLFDSIFSEICILMLDSHQRFIAQQEANRIAKKEAMKTKKSRK